MSFFISVNDKNPKTLYRETRIFAKIPTMGMEHSHRGNIVFPPWEYCVSSMGTNHIQYWNNQKYRHIIKENITNITTNITKLSPYSIGICVSLVML